MSEVTDQDVKIIRTEPLGSALMDVQDQSEHGLRLFEERVRVAKQQLAIALKLVSPGQFVVMSQTGKDGVVRESIYATGGAADRILRMGFGMRWGEKQVTLSRDSEGDQLAVARAPLLKHDGSVYEMVEGRRRMGGFVKTEADLIKGAIENMKHQAVTDMLGLRFLTPDDLKELGLDVSKLPRRADFQDRGPDESGEAIVPFGKKKGKKLSEVDAKDLDYYADAAQKAIADPAKAKWKAKEERWLAAVEAEKARRAAPPPDAAPQPSQAVKLTFGPPNLKGKTLGELSVADLSAALDLASQKLSEQPGATWANSVKQQAGAIEAEIDRREGEASESSDAAS